MLTCNLQNAKRTVIAIQEHYLFLGISISFEFLWSFSSKEAQRIIQILFCWLSLFLIWMYFKLMELCKSTLFQNFQRAFKLRSRS